MRTAAGVLLSSLAVACNSELRFPDSTAGRLDYDASTQDVSALDAPQENAPTQDGSGGACRIDGDCGLPDLHCDPTTFTCVQCTSDAHCGSGSRPRCALDLHRCVACDIDDDCGARARCEPNTHKCLKTCAMPCVPPMAQCDTAKDICIECTTDAECVRGMRDTCEIASGECVQCLSDSQCTGAALRCDPVSRMCVSCVSSADCAGRACDLSKGECAP